MKTEYQSAINDSMQKAVELVKKKKPTSSNGFMKLVDEVTESFRDKPFYDDLKFNVSYHLINLER